MLIILFKDESLPLIESLKLILATEMIAEGLRTENSFLFIFDELNQLFLNSLRVVDSIKLFEVDMKIFIRKCRPRL